MGLAGDMMYVPSVAVLSLYFKKKRTLAMTFASAGSAVGAVIHPIMINNLFFSGLGFRATTLASAGMITFALLIACMVMRPVKHGISTNFAFNAVWNIHIYTSISIEKCLLITSFYALHTACDDERVFLDWMSIPWLLCPLTWRLERARDCGVQLHCLDICDGRTDKYSQSCGYFNSIRLFLWTM